MIVFRMLDDKFMQRAIGLATKGHGFVSPNPKVGAVLVRDDNILSEGWHRKFGSKHAEVECLDAYDGLILGNETMYVTLEPCCHQGKQPACTERLIDSGIKHVVVGCLDPNPKVAGKGIERLREAGVEVTLSPMREVLKQINFGFNKWVTTKRPYTIVKVAMTQAGQIAPIPKKRHQITGPQAKELVYGLRSVVDAVLIGKGTLLIDNPELAARCQNGFEPLRVVWGELSSLNSYGSLDLFRNDRYRLMDSETTKELLKELGKAGVTSLLVEGGAHVFTSFLKAGLADEVHIFMNEDKPSFEKGLLAFEEMHPALRSLQGWKLETAKMGADRLYLFTARSGA